LGDHLYGQGTASLLADRLQLHARAVSLPLYPEKPPVRAEASPPAAMTPGLIACGWTIPAS